MHKTFPPAAQLEQMPSIDRRDSTWNPSTAPLATPLVSELHRQGHRTTGHRSSFVRNSCVSRLCPVAICPYLCTSD